jgi:hypothetical protein
MREHCNRLRTCLFNILTVSQFGLFTSQTMDFALKAVTAGEHSKVPVNVVTATYLDPRRYNKFVTVWSYLVAIGLLQIGQYQWVRSRSEIWEKRLKHWSDQMAGIPPDPNDAYEWTAFREDFLPQSVDSTLQKFSRDRSLVQPISIMGASYTDHVNVIFEEGEDIQFDPLRVGRNDGETKLSPQQIAEEMVRSLKEHYEELRSIDYKMLDVKHLPPWKSRFIKAPEMLPTEDEMREVLGEDYEAENPIREFDDEGEKTGEFQGNEFEEFLDEMEQQVADASLDIKQRANVILEDIERDRRDIVRRAIMSVREKAKTKQKR